jgi:hypothetical protein
MRSAHIDYDGDDDAMSKETINAESSKSKSKSPGTIYLDPKTGAALSGSSLIGLSGDLRRIEMAKNGNSVWSVMDKSDPEPNDLRNLVERVAKEKIEEEVENWWKRRNVGIPTRGFTKNSVNFKGKSNDIGTGLGSDSAEFEQVRKKRLQKCGRTHFVKGLGSYHLGCCEVHKKELEIYMERVRNGPNHCRSQLHLFGKSGQA